MGTTFKKKTNNAKFREIPTKFTFKNNCKMICTSAKSLRINSNDVNPIRSFILPIFLSNKKT